MARTSEQIKAQILANMVAESDLSAMNSTSTVAVYRLIAGAVALVLYGVEVLFDELKAEINTLIASLKPHRRTWYVSRALAFQYGSSLVTDTDYYNNSSLTDAQIAAQKIVNQCAITESEGQLTIKVVKLVSNELTPLSVGEVASFESYMAEVKDAGVRITVLSFNPDRLKMEIDVFYDPTILTTTGAMIDGSLSDPVGDAVRNYIKSAPFDSVFIKSKLVDALQSVSGVIVPEVRSCQAARFDVLNWQSVDISYSPYSGFLRIYNAPDLTLNFIAYA